MVISLIYVPNIRFLLRLSEATMDVSFMNFIFPAPISIIFYYYL